MCGCNVFGEFAAILCGNAIHVILAVSSIQISDCNGKATRTAVTTAAQMFIYWC